MAGSKQTAVANKRRSDEISKTLADDEPANKRVKDEQPSATSQSSATPQREAETPPAGKLSKKAKRKAAAAAAAEAVSRDNNKADEPRVSTEKSRDNKEKSRVKPTVEELEETGFQPYDYSKTDVDKMFEGKTLGSRLNQKRSCRCRCRLWNVAHHTY